MEAVRERSAVGHGQSPALLPNSLAASSTDQLPPPPAPFPTDLVIRDRQASTSTQATRETSQSNVDWHDLQSSCVQALTALLPDTSPSSSQSLSTSSKTLPVKDAQLASAITELLQVSYELESLRPFSTYMTTNDGRANGLNGHGTNTERPFDELKDGVQGMLQTSSQRASRAFAARERDIDNVRVGIAWERTEVLCRAILQLLSKRSGVQESKSGMDVDLPPDYSACESNTQPPPSYHHDNGHVAWTSLHPDSQSTPTEKEELQRRMEQREHYGSTTSAPSEKMIRDFDDMSAVIERLHPRLQDQRSEMRLSKTRDLAEIQQRIEKEKMRELEEIWRLIERTHGKRREVGDQRADAAEIEARRAARRKRFFETLLDNGESARLDDQDSPMPSVDANLARARDLKERDRFLQHLVETSDGGRLDNQDAQDPETAKQAFIDSVVAYSSNGRFKGQDSAPPTPKIKDVPTGDPFELVTVEDFLKTPLRSNGSSPEGLTRNRSNSSPLDSDRNKAGTLRKIAGMVRRGSLGLGLKVTNDLSTATFVAEHQENLRVVQVMLHGVGAGVKDELVIETDRSSRDDVNEATIVSKRDPSVSLRVSLPSAVLAGQSVPFTPQDLHLESKLAALPSISSNAGTLALPSHALSAQDLRNLKPKALCCTQCDREVADISKALREEHRSDGSGFKDLPSEHWAEMMEVWMCHNDPAFTAQLAKRTEEGFWPTRSTVLVGGSYLLVNADEGKQANLQVEQANNDGWAVMKCTCGEVMGKKRSEEAKFGAGTLRLSKWSVALLREDQSGETVEPIRFPLSVFVMSDILEMAQAHATYRFVLADEESGSVRALLWLFNPSVGISYKKSGATPLPSPLSQSSLSNGNVGALPGSKILKGAKILYKIVNGGSASDRPFGPTVQAETISYPPDVCSRLIAGLQESTALYPASRRTMGGYTIGFLERQ